MCSYNIHNINHDNKNTVQNNVIWFFNVIMFLEFHHNIEIYRQHVFSGSVYFGCGTTPVQQEAVTLHMRRHVRRQNARFTEEIFFLFGRRSLQSSLISFQPEKLKESGNPRCMPGQTPAPHMETFKIETEWITWHRQSLSVTALNCSGKRIRTTPE